MKCIFCKQDSSNAKSVEHIVPESLGNKNKILCKGVVCDKCNRYFALKIEKKLLETDYFINLRFRNGIESKKRKIPKGKAIIPKTKCEADVVLHKDRKIPMEVILDPESFEFVKNGDINHFILPINIDFPRDDQIVSRFIAKVALEMMALRIIQNDKYEQELFSQESALDPIRNYARFNHNNENWVYSCRKIYEEDEKFFLDTGEPVDIIFESDFLVTKDGEIYFVIAIKGVELVINMAGSSIEGYKKWLEENDNISPLYVKGKCFGYNLTPSFIF